MAVRIRLKRMGFRKRPYYRVVVMDAKTNRDGVAIDELGYYHPLESQNPVKLDIQKVEHWVKCGAQMTDTVRSLYRKLRSQKKENSEVAVGS